MPSAEPTDERPQRVLAVLGMHRSGTSCLTGSLQAGGLVLGKHHTWNKYNLKGNRENQDVVNLHEDVLKSNNANWTAPYRRSGLIDNFFSRKMKWQSQHFDRAIEILDEHSHEAIWGFKDPRALFLLHGWKQLVPDMEIVGIFRHPMAVAHSLNSRPAIPVAIKQGLQIWLAYNRALLKHYREKPFPLFSFDWDEEIFHGKLNTLHTELRIKTLDPGQRFYTNELHNQKIVGSVELPKQVELLYRELVSLAY